MYTQGERQTAFDRRTELKAEHNEQRHGLDGNVRNTLSLRKSLIHTVSFTVTSYREIMK